MATPGDAPKYNVFLELFASRWPSVRLACWLHNSPSMTSTQTTRAPTHPMRDACARFVPLVARVVRSLAARLPRHVDRDDLLAAGALGLVKALRRHMGEREEDLRRHVISRVRGEVLDYLRSVDPLTRRQRDAVSAARRRADEVERTAAGGPTLDERSARILSGLGAIRITSLENAPPLTAEATCPTETLTWRERAKSLQRAMGTVSPRLRRVIVRHYFEDASYAEIAAELGVSRARVSQLHNQALARLRDELAA